MPAAAALLLAGATPAPAASQTELADRVHRAGEVYQELRNVPDRNIPANLVARSRCIAVIPNVIKAAFIAGGRHGRGVMTCRGKTGEWSPPVHVQLTSGSVGLQAGASSTDVVLFFMNTASVKALLSNKIKLSGEAAVAAGPVGREAEAATDGQFTSPIYSYAQSRGLFVGMSLAGGYLGVDTDETREYYGAAYAPADILFGHKVTKVPKSAWNFLGRLPKPAAQTATKKAKPPGAAAKKKKTPAAVAKVAEPPAVAVAPPPSPPLQVLTPVDPSSPPIAAAPPSASDIDSMPAIIEPGDAPMRE